MTYSLQLWPIMYRRYLNRARDHLLRLIDRAVLLRLFPAIGSVHLLLDLGIVLILGSQLVYFGLKLELVASLGGDLVLVGLVSGGGLLFHVA
jgi:hypothetical protein